MFNKDNPFPAHIVENRLLSKPGSGKEVRHYVVDITGSGLSYKVGDALGIYPNNNMASVDELLLRAKATGAEMVSVPRTAGTMGLREVLFNQVSLNDPTRKFIELLAKKASPGTDRDKLEQLLAPEARERLAGYLLGCAFSDVLADFPGVPVTPQELVDCMRRLAPRLYSIASSPLLHPNQVHLTVATVRYEVNHRVRHGVCTTFLAERVETNRTPVPVFIAPSHFAPPEDGSKDIIMVGPGTGIAPFRAFMQERVARGASGRNWLIFGDQHRATDFLYEEEWADYLSRKQLTRLDLAWSRDQTTKDYVQHRMVSNAGELWSWLQGGAYFYVCGDAKKMAKDVDAALHEIAMLCGGLSAEGAEAYVKALKKENRYQRDVY